MPEEQTRCPEDVHLIIRFDAKSEYLLEFAGIMKTVEVDMADEPGFRSANVYQDIDDPNKFTLIEVWASRGAHEMHFAEIVASGVWQHILSLQQSPPVMGYTDSLRCSNW